MEKESMTEGSSAKPEPESEGPTILEDLIIVGASSSSLGAVTAVLAGAGTGMITGSAVPVPIVGTIAGGVIGAGIVGVKHWIETHPREIPETITITDEVSEESRPTTGTSQATEEPDSIAGTKEAPVKHKFTVTYKAPDFSAPSFISRIPQKIVRIGGDPTGFEAFVGIYEDMTDASIALAKLEQMHRSGEIRVVDAVTIHKDKDGVGIHITPTQVLEPDDGLGDGILISAAFGYLDQPLSPASEETLISTLQQMTGLLISEEPLAIEEEKNFFRELPAGLTILMAIVAIKEEDGTTFPSRLESTSYATAPLDANIVAEILELSKAARADK